MNRLTALRFLRLLLFLGSVVLGSTIPQALAQTAIPLSAPSSAPPSTAAPPLTHTVQPGDTLTRIAALYDVTVSEVAVHNALANPDVLEVGTVLEIPVFTLPDDLPWPFLSIQLNPRNLEQGNIVTLRVTLQAPATLQATYLERTFTLSPLATLATTASLPQSTPTQLATPVGAVEERTQTTSTRETNVTFAYQGLLAASVLTDPGTTTLRLTATLTTPENPNTTITTAVPLRIVAFRYEREQINLDPQTSQLLAPRYVANERARIASICDYDSTEKLWEGLFSFPVTEPTVTSAFGTLRSYNGGPYRSFHGGLDLRANATIPIYAPARGTVALAAPLMVRGNTVILRHGMGVCSLYNHLSSIALPADIIAEGGMVEKGTLLGYGGSTGVVTGPHLHWEVRVGNTLVNPFYWANRDLNLEEPAEFDPPDPDASAGSGSIRQDTDTVPVGLSENTEEYTSQETTPSSP